jgi:hypothetical protein
MPNARVFTPAVETPFAVAAAQHGAAKLPAHDEERKGQHHQRDDPAHDVEPDRGARVPAELGVELGQALADVAPREVGEAFEEPDEREWDRERREREVGPGEPRRGDAEREPDHAGGETAERDRPEVAHAVVDDEDRRRVRADAHERAVSERDLPREPGEDVEPE